MYGREINRRAVESFIKSGSFDAFGDSRRAMLEGLEKMLKSIEAESRRNLEGQITLFGGTEEEEKQNQYDLPKTPEYPHNELLRMEKEVSGLYLSGHPLDQYREQIRKIATANVSQLSGDSGANQISDHQIGFDDGLCHGGRSRRQYGTAGFSEGADPVRIGDL